MDEKCECGLKIPRGNGYYSGIASVQCLKCGKINKLKKDCPFMAFRQYSPDGASCTESCGLYVSHLGKCALWLIGAKHT